MTTNELPNGCVIGPSGIKRVSKWRNRHKKAAQHKLNHVERANRNRGKKKV